MATSGGTARRWAAGQCSAVTLLQSLWSLERMIKAQALTRLPSPTVCSTEMTMDLRAM